VASMRLCFYCAVAVGFVVSHVAQAALVVVQTTATADTFVQQNSPDASFGTKGALSVAGSAARNGSGGLVGLTDSFVQFNLASDVAALDAEFGPQSWAIRDIYLQVVEQTTANNPRFGRGRGRFEIRWIAADGWSEKALTWNTERNYLNDNNDVSVGTFTNLYHGDGYFPIQRFTLSRPEALVNDIRAGGDVSFYLSALDPSIGFTFNSKDITGTRPKPYLEIVAIVYDKEDLNHDGRVNFLDYAKLAQNWHKTGPALDGDLNGDGIIDYKDLEMLAEPWLAHDP
jgi:Dockerin type I domain